MNKPEVLAAELPINDNYIGLLELQDMIEFAVNAPFIRDQFRVKWSGPTSGVAHSPRMGSVHSPLVIHLDMDCEPNEPRTLRLQSEPLTLWRCSLWNRRAVHQMWTAIIHSLTCASNNIEFQNLVIATNDLLNGLRRPDLSSEEYQELFQLAFDNGVGFVSLEQKDWRREMTGPLAKAYASMILGMKEGDSEQMSEADAEIIRLVRLMPEAES